jgi:hypothetical protein
MIDFNSSAWKQIAQWIEAETERVRKRNDSTELTEAQTAALRGEIRFAKKILDLPNAATRGQAQPLE